MRQGGARPRSPRVLALVALSLVASCERSTNALLQRLTAADSGAVLAFPRQRTRLRSAPLRHADVRAPACSTLPPDTAQWRANVLPTALDDVSWITIRTPFRFPPSFPGAPRVPHTRIDTNTVDRLVASWSIERAGSPLPGGEEQGLALWLGAAAYPTELLPLGTQQITLSECISSFEDHKLHLVEYTLLWKSEDTTYHLSAYLLLHGDTALTALGRATTRELRSELAAAVRTLRLFR